MYYLGCCIVSINKIVILLRHTSLSVCLVCSTVDVCVTEERVEEQLITHLALSKFGPLSM